MAGNTSAGRGPAWHVWDPDWIASARPTRYGESPTGRDGPLTGGATTQKWLKSVRLDQARTTAASDGDLVTWEVRIEDRESFSGEEVTGLS